MNRSKLINVVGIAIGVAGIAFVARRIVRDRSEIADALSSADLAWLVVGGIAGLFAMGLIGVNWLLILRHAGATAPWRRGMSWFFVGQLGKYVPGGIWPIVGQAELAHRGNTPRRAAYSSTALSMVATFLGAATVAAISGLISPSDGRLLPVAIAMGLVLAFGVLVIPAARSMLDRLAERVTRKQLRLPAPSWFTLLVVRHLPVWVSFAGMNIFAVAALGSDLDASTKLTIERGRRNLEILKQPQFSPVKVEDQVAIIYASTNGLLDTVPVNRVREFEKEFGQVMNSRYPDVLKALKAGKLEDAGTKAIREVAKDVAASYAVK